jgi:DNA polymerase-1
MIKIEHVVAGETVLLQFPENDDDIREFVAWRARAPKTIACDTESTSLNIFGGNDWVRLVQFGDRGNGWMLDAQRWRSVIIETLLQDRYFVFHNAPFDLLQFDRNFGLTVEQMVGKVFDTRILAHLLDPRLESEGGVGVKLKPLSSVYVCPNAVDTQEGLTAEFNRLKFTKHTGWRHIPLTNEVYLRYAGLDVVYTARLLSKLSPMVKELGLSGLSQFEHRLAGALARIQRRGMRLDSAYAEKLVGSLLETEQEFVKISARYGVENVNSTAQVAGALAAMGETLTDRNPPTKTNREGSIKVDKEVLMPLADLDREWNRIEARQPNPLADAVLRAKRAKKWSISYAQASLNLMDPSGRIHPAIGGLQARTARMSVSSPPLQQLPSGDYVIRRMFLADPGRAIISVDYDQIEMRVLAALCQDRNLLAAAKSGEDIHAFTARLIKGDGFTKKDRKLFKGVGFGKVYGGGKVTLSRQTGADLTTVAAALREYDRKFPGIKRYSRTLIDRAEYGRAEVITPSGRRLPLDRNRLYSATNYMCQSSARDVLAQAILEIDDAGMLDYILLPVHDELILDAPVEDAQEIGDEIGRLMTMNFMGVPLTAGPEIGGPNWGTLYEEKLAA